ncbi:DUF2752 domain-containing protein [Nocardioides sp. Soil805]|uniref:DUF2752 domain-containing protein n=1 Tax=Nocardioides sp. Soil805 TaxID=1736416 RepID=UPI0007024BAD|nr:DUF2752 domain-containing protein [Nocardioides sp. Soil805]KRF34305.1 hypothetical protein ASG94_16470 [Nocardioides sp. Soil805]
MTGRARRLAAPLGTAALVAVATLALAVRDPHRPGSWGWCPTQVLTHLDCPLCGSLRAVHDLTRLDLGAAASSNLLLVVALPLVLALWLRRVAVAWRGGAAMRPVTVPSILWTLGLGVAVVFTVARNLPGSWLAA